ncbi:MAG: ABC transporter ATP-binding protein [Rhodobacteraceae bacterium]|nr:ABC transporter ATP-binding protein [Paracoccaceae bacterium]
MTARAGAAIRIERLNKIYGDLKAVDDVSLDIAAGEFLTLLGSSGSGKTTTLMIVAGFALPDSGNVWIGDRPITQLPPERRGLGVVFQSYALFPHLDVKENIAFPLRMRRVQAAEIERKVARVLELVELGAFRDRRIGQLSGGQQQRVALARALVFEPPVLLMDEPLGALDRKLREQLQVEIKRIQRDLGVTVIYVTHDQEEALSMSDRIAIMAEGRILQTGTPDEVYEAPHSAYVADFLGESNFIRGQASETGLLARTDGDPRCMAAARATVAAGAEAVGIVRPEAIRLEADTRGLPNQITGEIELREFLGADLRLSVLTPVGALTVRTPRLGQHAGLLPGARVTLGWSAEDMALFPADKGGT